MSTNIDIKSRKDIVYLTLAAFFITNAVLAEMIGVKLINVPIVIPWLGQPVSSIGVIPWPVVLVATDIMNEYFGKDGVRRITLITAAMIAYCFFIVYLSMLVPAAPFSPVNDEVFSNVFGQSLWIIVGSLVAFVASQVLDVWVFWVFREITGGKMLWLRSTGSTVISQIIDSIVVIGIAFWLPGKLTTSQFLNLAATNYSYKLAIAIGMTPVIYLVHGIIDRYLGHEAEVMIEASAEKSLHS